MGYLLHRLNDSVTAPTGYDLLKIATRGSAKVLGRDDIGYLAPGMAADFFMIRSDRIALIGGLEDVAAMPATIGFKGNVDYTVVGGRIVVADGELVTQEEGKLISQARQSVSRYLNMNG